MAVHRLREELPAHVLEEAWEREGEITEVMTHELPVVEEVVGGDEAQKVRRYAGVDGVGAGLP